MKINITNLGTYTNNIPNLYDGFYTSIIEVEPVNESYLEFIENKWYYYPSVLTYINDQKYVDLSLLIFFLTPDDAKKALGFISLDEAISALYPDLSTDLENLSFDTCLNGDIIRIADINYLFTGNLIVRVPNKLYNHHNTWINILAGYIFDFENAEYSYLENKFIPHDDIDITKLKSLNRFLVKNSSPCELSLERVSVGDDRINRDLAYYGFGKYLHDRTTFERINIEDVYIKDIKYNDFNLDKVIGNIKILDSGFLFNNEEIGDVCTLRDMIISEYGYYFRNPQDLKNILIFNGEYSKILYGESYISFRGVIKKRMWDTWDNYDDNIKLDVNHPNFSNFQNFISANRNNIFELINKYLGIKILKGYVVNGLKFQKPGKYLMSRINELPFVIDKISHFIEDYNDYIKIDDIKFEVLKGDDIQYGYNRENYHFKCGRIETSCLTSNGDTPPLLFTKLEYCSLLVGKKDGKIVSRSLLWEKNNKTYHDRIYGANPVTEKIHLGYLNSKKIKIITKASNEKDEKFKIPDEINLQDYRYYLDNLMFNEDRYLISKQ